MLIYELKNVDYLYSDKIPALKSINLEIEQGEQVTILGANGSGKSTLLKLLNGLIFPSSGVIKAFGEVLTEDILDGAGGEFRKKVGLVFQNPDVQLFCPTVFDEIAFGPLQLDLPREEIYQRVKDVMEMLSIENLRERAPYTLSGGEKKKIAIASVLSINPDVLLLDEPTNSLEPRTQRFMVELLLELHRIGKTIILATQDLDIAAEIGGRVLVFNEDHRIIADAPAYKVLADTDLLLKANLIHEHYHRHRDFSHTHIHGHFSEHRHSHPI